MLQRIALLFTILLMISTNSHAAGEGVRVEAGSDTARYGRYLRVVLDRPAKLLSRDGINWRLTGRYEAGLGWWLADKIRDSSSLVELRLRGESQLSWRKLPKWYFTGGTGLVLISSDDPFQEKRLGGHIQFGTHAGIGWRSDVRANPVEISARMEHISNGGLNSPNFGIDQLLLAVRFPIR